LPVELIHFLRGEENYRERAFGYGRRLKDLSPRIARKTTSGPAANWVFVKINLKPSVLGSELEACEHDRQRSISCVISPLGGAGREERPFPATLISARSYWNVTN
jgi:hypothetical protein